MKGHATGRGFQFRGLRLERPGAGNTRVRNRLSSPAQIQAFSLCQLRSRRIPLPMSEESQEGGLPVMTSDTGLASLAIEEVLELSGDAHIEKTHDGPGLRRPSPTYGSGLWESALGPCRPRRAGRVLRHDCPAEPAGFGYRAGSLILELQYVAEELSGM